MTLRELRKETDSICEALEKLAVFARNDEFAPWVVEALETAARFGSLSDEVLRELKDVDA